jgi:hypothetical protein
MRTLNNAKPPTNIFGNFWTFVPWVCYCYRDMDELYFLKMLVNPGFRMVSSSQQPARNKQTETLKE